MKQFFQSITAFTKRERRGTFVFLSVLITLIIINRNLSSFIEAEPWFTTTDSVKLNEWLNELQTRKLNLHPFNPNKIDLQQLIEMGLPASICENWSKYVDAGGKFYSKANVRKLYGMSDSIFYKVEPYLIIPNKRTYHYNEYKPARKINEIGDFDPNSYSKKDLIKAGLSKTIASNIIKYREGGGEFANKCDLKKLYTVNDKNFDKLKSHIIITEKSAPIVKLDSVELNSTTIEELTHLGIKKQVAASIIRFRKSLGGFYAKDQLGEVYHIDEYSLKLLEENTWIDTLLIRRINLNKIDANNLSRHPYISYSQARQLIKYKNFAEKIENFQEISRLKIFPKDLALKLRIYFAF